MTHDFGARGVGPHREASSDDFAKRQHVRLDVVQASGTLKPYAESADDLVEKKQDAFACAYAAHLTE